MNNNNNTEDIHVSIQRSIETARNQANLTRALMDALERERIAAAEALAESQIILADIEKVLSKVQNI